MDSLDKMAHKVSLDLYRSMAQRNHQLSESNNALLEAAIQALAALKSADVHGYQNSLCKQKAIDMLEKARKEAG